MGMAGLDTPSSIPIARAAIVARFALDDAQASQLVVTNDANLLSGAIARPPHEHIRTGICLIAGTGASQSARCRLTA